MKSTENLRLIIPAIASFLLLAVSCSKVSESTPPSNQSQSEAEVKAVLTDMWDAVEKADIDRYAGYVHPDFTQFGEYDSVLRVGKPAEVEAMGKYMREATGVHTDMIAPQVIVKGDVAWVVYYWSDYGTLDGKQFATHGKSTRIFAKEGDRWLCIHGHYTLLPFLKK